MARSQLADVSTDLQSDGGSVLWSLVQGEQLEFPITLNFIENVGLDYTFEAVVMEAANISGDASVPIVARTGGMHTELVVRVPTDKGTWNPTTVYEREDVVLYNELYYKLSVGSGYISATPPDTDTSHWATYTPNRVYIQFPADLSTASSNSVTITSATPGVITWASHPFVEGNPVIFGGTAAPTGLVLGTTYYVTSTSLTVDTFTVSATVGGAAIATSSTGTDVTATKPAWEVQPTTISSIHGFFELRVTEPSGGVFRRTWKPMRGLIEILYSPTNLVS